MTSYCSYTPTGKEQSTQNKTKMCAIIVFYVYFVLYIELLFGDVGLNGRLKTKVTVVQYPVSLTGMTITYYGTALMSFSHDGVVGAALFYINSTGSRLDAIEILNTSNGKITFTSADLKTKTFNVSWKGLGFWTSFIEIRNYNS